MSQPVRVAFVGTGGIAGSHLKQLANLNEASAEPLVQIAAVCDVDETRASAFAQSCGATAVYTDHRTLLDKEGNGLDALYICVPPFAHADVEILAAEAGLHLFVEKPVVLELDQGLHILEAIRAAGVMSSVGYTLRYRHPWRTARDLLHERTIAMLSADRWGGMPGEGHWWRDYSKSGGQLHEQTTHQVDCMRWVAGDVETVFARYGHQVAQGIPRLSVPDSQIVVLEFASGTVGYISTSCVLRQGGGLNHMQVLLEDARIDVGRELIIQPEDALAMPAAYDGDDIDGAFIRAVASGDRSHILCDYEEGLKTAAVSIAANQSAASGQAERCWNG